MMTINWTAEILDTVASLSGHYGRWLNARKNRICFIIWAICTTYWAIRDFRLGLYSQAIFCIFSIALNVYGYFNWKTMNVASDKKQATSVSEKENTENEVVN